MTVSLQAAAVPPAIDTSHHRMATFLTPHHRMALLHLCSLKLTTTFGCADIGLFTSNKHRHIHTHIHACAIHTYLFTLSVFLRGFCDFYCVSS